MTTATDRTREMRLRRTAQRRGLQLTKSRRRDELARDYGTWAILDGSTIVSSDLDMDGVESELDRLARQRKTPT